ncbi:MAG: hypothetical protein ABI346_03845, partial [Candidatus Baltobacteraceae bacterium]
GEGSPVGDDRERIGMLQRRSGEQFVDGCVALVSRSLAGTENDGLNVRVTAPRRDSALARIDRCDDVAS